MKDLGLCLLKVQRDDPQGAGSASQATPSAIALLSIFGLAQEDDDGNAASKLPSRSQAPKRVQVGEVVQAGQQGALRLHRRQHEACSATTRRHGRPSPSSCSATLRPRTNSPTSWLRSWTSTWWALIAERKPDIEQIAARAGVAVISFY